MGYLLMEGNSKNDGLRADDFGDIGVWLIMIDVG